ncbi:Aste57867_23064 [Aphanomyces stellatus]|uniref:Aste57867_23064 protein n=1 Tax=Aphanomyces stellatus TaxID=120398 RepID=A0A485LMK8_9STRA|nr:hypothetical protein As57867_022993 [Aphanomyces stellatus]VFT99712.1 Aste57867_23064 [Aphanomyces stellatus]
MQFYQRPDLNGAGSFVSASVQKKENVPVQLLLPDEQVLLGFPPASGATVQPATVNATDKAVFMTNPMRRHPQVQEFQILFTLIAAVNVAFTLSFVSPTDRRAAWFNTQSFASTTTPPPALPLAMFVSICVSNVVGVVLVWTKFPLLLRLFVFYTFFQGLVLTQCIGNFLLVLRFPLDMALGYLAHRIHTSVVRHNRSNPSNAHYPSHNRPAGGLLRATSSTNESTLPRLLNQVKEDDVVI